MRRVLFGWAMVLGLGCTANVAPLTLDETAGGEGGAAADESADGGAGGAEVAFKKSAWSCDGLTGKTKSPAGNYYITAFGCWKDANGHAHGDPGDNCIPSAVGHPGYKQLCGNLSGPACERHVNWYAADADRFGFFTRIKVTNPHNGKSAVLAVIDRGPSCFVEKKVHHWVLDVSVPAAEYLWHEEPGAGEKRDVVVEVVPSSTPLGPVKK